MTVMLQRGSIQKRKRPCKKHWWSEWADSKFTWNDYEEWTCVGRFCRECVKVQIKPLRD